MSETPDFTLEIHRYSKPEELFNFFHFEARENGENYPFEKLNDDGTAYAEVGRETNVRDPERVRDYLRTARFIAHPVGALDDDFASWVIHTQCPIEWHSGLDARESEMTDRVTVWIRDRS